MEKIIFKTITSKEEISVVLDKIESYSGVRLPMTYALDSKIVGVFLHDQLVAGYMIVTKSDFRSLLFVPDQIKKTNQFFENEKYEMMEVNGLWISPALKKPSLQVRVWMHLIIDIFVSRKKYVLLLRNTRNKAMERFFSMANPTELYVGAPLLMVGENTHDEIQVSYTTRWSIVLNIHKYYLELRDRQHRADRFSKQRDYARTLKRSESEFLLVD